MLVFFRLVFPYYYIILYLYVFTNAADRCENTLFFTSAAERHENPLFEHKNAAEGCEKWCARTAISYTTRFRQVILTGIIKSVV